MKDSKKNTKFQSGKPKEKDKNTNDNTHLGSPNAFEKTENPLSRDDDNISDEKLDELIKE
jgi:hypothetical protein